MSAIRALPPLLTPRELARVYRVDPKTVTRWAAAGKVKATKTLGGHRRFPTNNVIEALMVDGASLDEAMALIAQAVH